MPNLSGEVITGLSSAAGTTFTLFASTRQTSNFVARIRRVTGTIGSATTTDVSPVSTNLGVWVTKPDRSNSARVLAFNTGLATAYLSTNQGTTWSAIPLPAVAPNDMVGLPGSNVTFFATYDQSVLRTDDGGAVWYIWNKGLPQLSEFAGYDSVLSVTRDTSGVPWIFFGSEQRGLWRRQVETYVNNRTYSLVVSRVSSVKTTTVQIESQPIDEGPVRSVTVAALTNPSTASMGSLAPIRHRMWVKPRGHLAFAATVNLTSGNVSSGTISFVNGDVDNDNEISLLDYIAVSEAYDTVPGDTLWNADADLDGDNAVSILDYLIVSSNYEMVGAPRVP